ncbi:MAG: MFS transporter [Clostridiaceae bacterium]|nr:MFS transporter [Clostridiaceae bacterium]
MKLTYKHTLYASYIGFITLAIINNLAPLLFVTFQREFDLSLEQIGFLISLNFGVQIFIDTVSAKYADKLGYRFCAVLAHVLCVSGLLLMGLIPFVFTNGYAGLLAAVILNGIGGGLLEVLISPIVESLPGDEKASAMSLLHSFYCWGHVAVVLLSTLYFVLAGINRWYWLPIIWSFVPAANIFLFSTVPLRKIVDDEQKIPLRELFREKYFRLFIVLMICAGSAELAMSQWSSLFAEIGLGVSKTAGDLLGPCAFAALMGLSRTFYGIKGSKINLHKALSFSSILCISSYLITVFSPLPVISLIGCALCGLSVGMMWPGTLSLAAKQFRRGGTALFAILALAGDVGCSFGPGFVGLTSNAVQKAPHIFTSGLFSGTDATGTGLRTGLLFAVIFPVVLWIGIGKIASSKSTIIE